MSQNLSSAAVVIGALRVNLCFGWPKEPSPMMVTIYFDSFEYPQRVFWFRKKKIII